MAVTFLTDEDAVVRYDEQTLTPEQQTQARKNIGAADAACIGSVVVSDNKFDNNYGEEGRLDLTTGEEINEQGYKRTGYYDLGENANYAHFIRPAASGAPIVLYYDVDKNYIGYSMLAATDQVISRRITQNERYFRVYAGSAFTGVLYASNIMPDPATVDYTYKEAVQVCGITIKNSVDGVFADKTFVFLGDSVYGNNDTETGIVAKFAAKTGATCHNFAFGGTRAKTRGDGTGWAKLDGQNLAVAIATGNYAEQEAAIPTLETSMKDMFTARITAMKTFNWSKVDYIVCDWGTNDWYGTTPANYKSAVKDIIATILTAYPNISFVKCTPLQRFIQENGEWLSGNERQDATTSAKLVDFVEADKEIAEEENIRVIDCFNIGINKYTRTHFFTEPDCTHPNPAGNELVACYLANHI